MTATDPLPPGSTIGVLGGGQLGRMLAIAARRMGYEVAVLAPEADGPASQVASRSVRADYHDRPAVEAFAKSIDVLTFEFENVPSAVVDAAVPHVPVRPGGSLLNTAQNRLREKRALRDLGIGVAPFAPVETDGDLAPAVDTVGRDGVLKTAAFGYDGKGQRRVRPDDDLAAAWEELGRVPCVYEGFVGFEAELSVVGARGVDGEIALYPPAENDHANHILDVSVAPALVPPPVLDDAAEIARLILEGLDVVGVLCVELFLLPDGGLLANEIAPRPHNSGHLTIEGAACSQFEQQARAACGLPLGSTDLMRPAAMANLLGDLWAGGTPDWAAALRVPGVALHLYGKAEPRPGRKMGHLTAIGDTGEEARALVERARAALTGS